MTEPKQMSQEEQQEWVRKQYQVGTKYLAKKGMVTESVIVDESRYIVPLLAIWKLKLLDGSFMWVLCGDLPTDHSGIDAAPTAREAIRHFSFKWQMQADSLLKSDQTEQVNFAKLLIGRAEDLYDLYSDDKLWGIDN